MGHKLKKKILLKWNELKFSSNLNDVYRAYYSNMAWHTRLVASLCFSKDLSLNKVVWGPNCNRWLRCFIVTSYVVNAIDCKNWMYDISNGVLWIKYLGIDLIYK